MKQLTPSLVETVRSAFKGAKLAKFDASIAILNESLAQGAWVTRGSIKAQSGFYQGITRTDFQTDYRKNHDLQHEAWELEHCLNYGGTFRGSNFERALATLKAGLTHKGEPVKLKISDEVVRAWIALCEEKKRAYQLLEISRPKPVITKIGLSPKVTKTLTEMNLDLELPSIRMADIDFYDVDGFDENDKPIKVRIYYVKWTPGILHGKSRFSDGGGCHACGKSIPSGRFVPIEAMDKKSRKLISMWLGCDCARNIFGIKDVGIDPKAKAKS